jgi:hypothetical protein
VNFVDEDIPEDVLSMTDEINSSTQDHKKILEASEFAGIEGQVRSLDELSGARLIGSNFVYNLYFKQL